MTDTLTVTRSPASGTELDSAGPAGARLARLRVGPAVPGRIVIGPAMVLLAWSAGSGLGLIDPRILPTPWSIVSTTADLLARGTLQSDLLISSVRALIGLAGGIVAGVLLALLSGLSRIGEVVIDGPIQVKRAIPTLALIPLLILWFGIGEPMKIITIALGVLIPIYLHTHNGLRSIDRGFVELAETVGLGRLAFVRRVILPGALPGFFLGLRFAVTGSWLSLVVVEQVNATSGIGYMMTLARSYGQLDVIFVGLAVYAVFGLLSDAVVRLLSRKALSWRRTLAD